MTCRRKVSRGFFAAAQIVDKPQESMKGLWPFHQQSAGGGVYVAEEQPEVASAINSWPKNEPIQRFFTLNRPFFKELMDRMKGEFQFRFHSQGVENSFSTP